MKTLKLAGCSLGKFEMDALAEGFTKPGSLDLLDLSRNKLTAKCFDNWANSNECVGIFTLKSLNLADNPSMGNHAAMKLLHAFTSRYMKVNKQTTLKPLLQDLNLKNIALE